MSQLSCCVEDKGHNTRRNGDHGGARARQQARLGEQGFAAMKDYGLHDADDEDIGGVMTDWEDSDEEEEEEDSSTPPSSDDDDAMSQSSSDEDGRKRPAEKSWRARLVGKRFKDSESKEVFKVRDVYWAEGYAPAAEDDDEPFEGWVAEYYPCPTGKRKAKDPGPDHHSVEWSPVEFLRGKESWAKWL